ncbi:MAG: Phosphatidylserine decarboxylase proenzyme [Candidatus Dichloromethanomonas elyunquensis]|nr:MAG: Phosphatidylserine decarboxylase proenzyme [Candidatus Dichloromethanomonas elyunquensis]
MPIYFLDRKTRECHEEIVAGDQFLKWLYEANSGLVLLESIVKRKLFSFLYGKFQDMPPSRKKIKGFIEDLGIDMREAKQEEVDSYRTFNEFFTRELKASARPIPSDPNILVSPVDGKILAWENIDKDRLLQVKGGYYSLEELLQNRELASSYHQGTCLIIRLCPADYHRFHFPDRGVPSQSKKINGCYYSVNPLALKKINKVYCANKRELTLFKSDNFGEMLLIEVGATCVGSIIQTFSPEQPVEKGSEKGYFKFGGSTTIMFLKKDTVQIDSDLLANTLEGMETKIRMGEQIGQK